MEARYIWYRVINRTENIQQGDFIPNCPIVIPSHIPAEGTVDARVQEYNVVILSQSCDLDFGKISLVLVCPVWPLRVFSEKSDFLKSTNGKEVLRKGNLPGYHLLNKCEKKRFKTDDYWVVDFHNVFGVNYEFLKKFAESLGQRLRLLPPYREHLSQAFARFFMRVGLPVDIPQFKKNK